MNNFALEIWDNELEFVTYYTVRWEDNPKTETDKFVEKFYNHATYHEALQSLLSLLFDQIGNRFGARKEFFSRKENRAEALPPSNVRFYEIQLRYPNFPLRLFCYRVSDSIVILFNGGPKTAATAQQSEELQMPFYHANEFSRRIHEAFRDKIIKITDDGQSIMDAGGDNEIIL
jgi:hypothetical protein